MLVLFETPAGYAIFKVCEYTANILRALIVVFFCKKLSINLRVET